LYLDEFGFPELAVVNSVLLNQDSYGESREEIEKSWEKWIHHIPFDSPVARALAVLYNQRLDKLNREKDAAAYQRLERKLDLVQRRAERYKIDMFRSPPPVNPALGL
jgi:hypothetical protein